MRFHWNSSNIDVYQNRSILYATAPINYYCCDESKTDIHAAYYDEHEYPDKSKKLKQYEAVRLCVDADSLNFKYSHN